MPKAKKQPNKNDPRYKVWTEEQIEQFKELCRIQCTKPEICSIMGVSDKTLSRIISDQLGMTYCDAYEKYSSHGLASVRRAQMYSATKKHNPSMLIWLGKVMLNQSEMSEEEKANNWDKLAVLFGALDQQVKAVNDEA